MFLISLPTLIKKNFHFKVKFNFYDLLKLTFLQYSIFSRFFIWRFPNFVIIQKRITLMLEVCTILLFYQLLCLMKFSKYFDLFWDVDGHFQFYFLGQKVWKWNTKLLIYYYNTNQKILKINMHNFFCIGIILTSNFDNIFFKNYFVV